MDISRDTPQSDIRKSFRKASLKYHPDKNKSPEAYEIYLGLNENVEILKDEELRSYYDYYLTKTQPKVEKPTAQGKTQAEYENAIFFSKVIQSLGCVPFYVAWLFIPLAYLSKNRRITKLVLLLLVGGLGALEFTFMVQIMNEILANLIKTFIPSQWTFKEAFIVIHLIVPNLIVLVIVLMELFYYKNDEAKEEDQDDLLKEDVNKQLEIAEDTLYLQNDFIEYLKELKSYTYEDGQRIYSKNVKILENIRKLQSVEGDLVKKESKWTLKTIIQLFIFGSLIVGFLTGSTSDAKISD